MVGGAVEKSTKKSDGTAMAGEAAWQKLLRQALQAQATDIHLEPEAEGLLVRFRQHGRMSPQTNLSAEIIKPLTRYLKSAAGLDSRQTKAPQDGHFSQTRDNHTYEISVATMPLEAGERLVIHFRETGGPLPALETLGLWGESLKRVHGALVQPHGFVLLSGPNHSGIATTLASFGSALDNPLHLIASVEDTAALHVSGARYMTVQPSLGMTWSRVLRMQLKHEPDILILGNVPDRETAKLAVNAAHAQQLVLAAVRADSSAAAVAQVTRLSNDALTLASNVRLVSNQRLVARLCPSCREAYTPDIALLQRLVKLFQLDHPVVIGHMQQLEHAAMQHDFGDQKINSKPAVTERGIARLWRAKTGGCEACHTSGYSGAIGLFEVTAISDQLRNQIATAASVSSLQASIREARAMSLSVDGFIKALRGLVAIESVPGL